MTWLFDTALLFLPVILGLVALAIYGCLRVSAFNNRMNEAGHPACEVCRGLGYRAEGMVIYKCECRVTGQPQREEQK